MSNSSIFKNVLHIGPNYKDYKGGTGAVLAIYHNNMPHFNFISSYEGNYSTIANVPYFATTLAKLVWLLSINNNIKLIHIHGHGDGSFYRKYILFLLAKFIFRKKVIFHLHGADFHIFYQKSNSLLKKQIEYFFNNSDCIIVLSKWWLNFVQSNFTPKKVLILNNPIEVSNSLSEQDLNKNNKISFLFMGRIGHRKGIFDLLDVIAQNYEYYQEKILLKVGGDGEVEKLISFINQNKLNDLVEYIGWVDGKSKHSFLSTCDVLILPSYNEGLPIAILEAMSYGKAIISTDVGGISEVVHDKINGFLIEPGDKEAIKEKIDFLLANKICLRSMGNKSLDIILNYDIHEVLKSMQMLYSELLISRS